MSQANLTLSAALDRAADPEQQSGEYALEHELDPRAWRRPNKPGGSWVVLSEVSVRALDGLKFDAAIPKHLAERIPSARLADGDGAWTLLVGANMVRADVNLIPGP